MLHLRLIVASDLAASIVDELRANSGVAHVVHLADVSASPPGHLVLCDVAREAANDVIESLQRKGVHHDGAITVSDMQTVVSDAAADADRTAPGQPADALIWEELEARARDDSQLSITFLTFMGIAAIIAGIGILLDAPILIVGAMVLGPEYGPLAALCVGAVRRRQKPLARAAVTLAAGLAVAAVVTLVAAVVFRATAIGPDQYDLSDRQLTAFISHPDGMAAVVAVLAGIAGMLSLTGGRGDALIGVLVSVTTIPAVANIGVAGAYREWDEMGGAAAQLLINVAGLVFAGIVTLMVQSRRQHSDDVDPAAGWSP